MAAAAGLGACASTPRPVSKIVRGHIVVTRAISPEAYDHVTRALVYEEEQRWEDAARELQRALPFDDEAAEIRAHLSDLFVRLGRLDDAAEQVQRSLQIAPTVEGHLAAAHLAEVRHDQNLALDHYRGAAALALSDESPDAIERTHLALADAQLAALDVPAAYQTVRTLEGACPDSVRARVELAALGWALGRLPETEASLHEALRLEPAEVDAELMQAALLAATGRTDDAKRAFHETLERAEDSVEVAEMFLKWLVARGDRAEAAEVADRLTPDVVDEGTVDLVIRLERASGRPERVKAAADEGIKKGAPADRLALLTSAALFDARDFSGSAARALAVSKSATNAAFVESRLRAAEALRESGSPTDLARGSHALDEAAAALEGTASTGAAASTGSTTGDGTAAPVRDLGVDLAVGRALLEEKRGDAVRAARTLDAALEKDPDNARLLLVRAAIDERRGDWRHALSLAEKILASDPRHVEALNFHGFVSVDHDFQLPLATRRLQVAVALDPGAGGIVDSLGCAYLHAGDLGRAGELLLEADRLEPGDPEILSHLADLFARQRDVARAIATYRQALQKNPTDRLARDITTRLHALEAKRAAER